MRVFVVCPPAYVTGGPEALHQLVSTTAALGFDASIVYSPEGHPQPTAPPYERYECRVSPRIDDAPDAVVVVPETETPLLAGLGLARRVMWWLSVDNFVSRRDAMAGGPGRPSPLDFVYAPAANVLHLAQSRYAADHVVSRGLLASSVTDYLTPESVAELQALREGPKEDFVAYNPAKGFEVTRRLMARAPHLTWVPIQGLTRSGVVDLLGRCKAYVDFGNHPGRDRLPREAALAGACVLVGRRGSATNDIDVPVPAEYKFDAGPSADGRVVSLLEAIMSDHSRHAARFSPYVRQITAQQGIFTDEVFTVMGMLEAQMATTRRLHV